MEQFTAWSSGNVFYHQLELLSFHCSGNILHVGDHIPWHQPLDGGKDSRIQHMLVAEEPQLQNLDTPYGTAQFRQVNHQGFPTS